MFTEQNTVEQMILDTLSGSRSQPHVIGEAKVGYQSALFRYVPAESLPRAYSKALGSPVARYLPCALRKRLWDCGWCQTHLTGVKGAFSYQNHLK